MPSFEFARISGEIVGLPQTTTSKFVSTALPVATEPTRKSGYASSPEMANVGDESSTVRPNVSIGLADTSVLERDASIAKGKDE